MPRVTRIILTAAAAVLTFGPLAMAQNPPAASPPVFVDPFAELKSVDSKAAATMHLVTAEGIGAPIGFVNVVKSADGAVFNVSLRLLPPGPHGMHVHTNGSCDPATLNGVTAAAGAAGGHWDPGGTGKHLGPNGAGHNGDLPVLEIIADGTATKSIVVPHLTDPGTLHGHALVIHAGGDNYADQPAPLGGGGARIACGVFD